MCGIVALLDPRRGRHLGELAQRMSTCLRHRGPDEASVWEDPEQGVALGHRRLAIVELSALGAQPMRSRDGRYQLGFNGEIYNYRSLRAELEARGDRFCGGSDTEVALAAMAAWGIRGAVERMAGMFAMTIWDAERRELVLVRDRLGEKPLYYGTVGGCLVAASELKAFAAHPQWRGEIDRDVVALYLRSNYVPSPFSIYRGVRKLPPGTFSAISVANVADGRLPTPEPYWRLASVALEGRARPFRGSVEEATDALEAILERVVDEQMHADVPLGALLSGGVDSSTIVSLMQRARGRPVRTFTIRVDDDPAMDESVHARAVAEHLGTEHTELGVSAADALAIVPTLPQMYDEPFGDSSQIPTSLVARLARRHVTVCLTGDGGDEAFLGYNRHVALAAFLRREARLPRTARWLLAGALDAVPTRTWDAVLRRRQRRVFGEQVQKWAALLREDVPEDMYLRLASIWPKPERLIPDSQRLATALTCVDAWPPLADPIDRMLWVEGVTSLPDDMLVKVDRATMAVALETRAPLVDHRVVEFAWSLPQHFLLTEGRGKSILRRVLYRHVPPVLVDRAKAGFSVPIDRWLRRELREWAEALIDERRLREEGFFDAALVRATWREHLSGRRNWQGRLWGVLMFQAWLERWGTGRG